MAYLLHSICLVNEERHCRCSRVYSVPSSLMLVLTTKNKRVFCQPPVNILEFDLPREARTFIVPIMACSACFEVTDSLNQLRLFEPKPSPEKYDLFNLEIEEFHSQRSAVTLLPVKKILERMNHVGGKDKNHTVVPIKEGRSVYTTKEKKATKAKKVVKSVEDFF